MFVNIYYMTSTWSSDCPVDTFPLRTNRLRKVTSYENEVSYQTDHTSFLSFTVNIRDTRDTQLFLALSTPNSAGLSFVPRGLPEPSSGIGPSVPNSAPRYLGGRITVVSCEGNPFFRFAKIRLAKVLTSKGRNLSILPARYRRYRRNIIVAKYPSIMPIKIPDNAIAAVLALEVALLETSPSAPLRSAVPPLSAAGVPPGWIDDVVIDLLVSGDDNRLADNRLADSSFLVVVGVGSEVIDDSLISISVVGVSDVICRSVDDA